MSTSSLLLSILSASRLSTSLNWNKLSVPPARPSAVRRDSFKERSNSLMVSLPSPEKPDSSG